MKVDNGLDMREDGGRSCHFILESCEVWAFTVRKSEYSSSVDYRFSQASVCTLYT
jgi:hypothetical protein